MEEPQHGYVVCLVSLPSSSLPLRFPFDSSSKTKHLSPHFPSQVEGQVEGQSFTAEVEELTAGNLPQKLKNTTGFPSKVKNKNCRFPLNPSHTSLRRARSARPRPRRPAGTLRRQGEGGHAEHQDDAQLAPGASALRRRAKLDAKASHFGAFFCFSARFWRNSARRGKTRRDVCCGFSAGSKEVDGSWV